MRRALRLAASGTGATYPNPCVGAVVARGTRVLGTGRSRATGGAHAEVVALGKAGRGAKGGTLYVSLEPCSHEGLTPPCTSAILSAGIARVVVGVRDPAEHARGRGLSQLRRAGVEVLELLADEAAAVHSHYIHHVKTGRPWVTLKAAVSLDGQLAVSSGDSKWITGERARRDVHRLRARHHAILVGRATVESDDPALTVRLTRGVDPSPVVLDSKLALASLVGRRQLLRPGTLIIHTRAASASRRKKLAGAGVELLQVRATRDGRVSIPALLTALGKRQVRSLMVEGGGEVLASFVSAKAWQEGRLYQAPRLLGEGRALLSGLSWRRVSDAPTVRIRERRKLGVDTLLVLTPPE